MISIVNAQAYCCEPINLIENYEKALNAEEKWEVHHRLETDLNLLKQDLIDKGLYYNRPANELIFLNPTEHRSLHHTGKTHVKGRTYVMKEETKHKIGDANRGNSACGRPGHVDSDETIEKRRDKMIGHKFSDETKKKQSDKKKEYYKTHSPWNKGMKNGLNGKGSPIKGKHKVWDNKELNIYHFE